MREYEKFLPEMNGRVSKLDGHPDDEIWVYVEEEDEPICDYCGEYDPEEKKIWFVYEGKTMYCCESCFREWIHDEKEHDYEEAIMILRNRLPGVTGIADVDEHPDELIESLEEARQAELMQSAALYRIMNIEKGVA